MRRAHPRGRGSKPIHKAYPKKRKSNVIQLVDYSSSGDQEAIPSIPVVSDSSDENQIPLEINTSSNDDDNDQMVNLSQKPQLNLTIEEEEEDIDVPTIQTKVETKVETKKPVKPPKGKRGRGKRGARGGGTPIRRARVKRPDSRSHISQNHSVLQNDGQKRSPYLEEEGEEERNDKNSISRSNVHQNNQNYDYNNQSDDQINQYDYQDDYQNNDQNNDQNGYQNGYQNVYQNDYQNNQSNLDNEDNNTNSEHNNQGNQQNQVSKNVQIPYNPGSPNSILDSLLEQLSYSRILIEDSSLLRRKHYRYDINECPLLYAYKASSKLLLVGSTRNIADSPKYAVFYHQHSTRFTITTTSSSTPNSFMENGLAGVGFYNQRINSLTNARVMNICLPTRIPYTAIDKENELSRIAIKGISSEGIKVFQSVLPHLNDRGELTNYFGKSYAVASIKNLIVVDDKTKKPIYLFLRASKAMFSIRYDKDLFSPEVAFCIGLTICESHS